MLLSDDMYSNFWCGMTPFYSYKRTDEYMEILYRKKVGCFVVPMVNSAVLINLRSHISDKLTFDPGKMINYDGPVDDIITFAVSAIKSGNFVETCRYYVTNGKKVYCTNSENELHTLLNCNQ